MLDEMITRELVKRALDARANAYAPYSGYKVGAAVLAVSGTIYTGCNVENASFGATLCAERVACAAAVTAGESLITAVAVATLSDEPAAPCGICRQFLAEFGPDIEIILVNTRGKLIQTNLTALLPRQFKLKGRANARK
ncbi:MAG: cytidine deaminase [Myxococcota bacterium]|jgi:cytidine deaminase